MISDIPSVFQVHFWIYDLDASMENCNGVPKKYIFNFIHSIRILERYGPPCEKMVFAIRRHLE